MAGGDKMKVPRCRGRSRGRVYYMYVLTFQNSSEGKC